MSKDKKNTAIYTAYDDESPYDIAWPEKGLLRAILVTAMNDAKKSGDVKQQAEQFFLSEEDDYIFSFKAICDYLNVDSQKVLKLTGIKESNNSQRQTQDKVSSSKELREEL